MPASHEEYVNLLAAHKEQLMTYARILTFNRESDAEEVFQNAMIVAWEKFADYDPAKDFGAWVCRMAFYEAKKLQQSRARISYLSEEALAALADAAIPVSRTLENRQESLAECLAKLDESDRRMVEARYLHAYRPKELASRVGRSVKAIYRDLSRIHGLLLRCIERSIRTNEVS